MKFLISGTFSDATDADVDADVDTDVDADVDDADADFDVSDLNLEERISELIILFQDFKTSTFRTIVKKELDNFGRKFIATKNLEGSKEVL